MIGLSKIVFSRDSCFKQSNEIIRIITPPPTQTALRASAWEANSTANMRLNGIGVGARFPLPPAESSSCVCVLGLVHKKSMLLRPSASLPPSEFHD